jgi:hypothetical protein
MAIHFNYEKDIHTKERLLKEERKHQNQEDKIRKQKEEVLRQKQIAAEKEAI